MKSYTLQHRTEPLFRHDSVSSVEHASGLGVPDHGLRETILLCFVLILFFCLAVLKSTKASKNKEPQQELNEAAVLSLRERVRLYELFTRNKRVAGCIMRPPLVRIMIYVYMYICAFISQ